MTDYYGLTTLPDWTHRTEDNALIKDWSGPARWSGARFPEPPPIGTRVLIMFNEFGLGTVVAYFVKSGWLGVEVACDQRPAWHIAQNPGPRNPLVFGTEIKPAPAVILARAAGGYKQHVVVAGGSVALCGFKPSGKRGAWYKVSDKQAPNIDGRGCKVCLAHPSASYLADRLAEGAR